MISPTVGRVVWYYSAPNTEPFAAIVAHVWDDRLINVMQIDSNGIPHSRTSVKLLQDGDPAPEYNYCAWMPYQKGQAAKTEQMAAALGKPS